MLYYYDCIKAFRSGILRLAICAECMWNVKCRAVKTYAGNLKGRNHLGKPARRWEEDKTGFK